MPPAAQPDTQPTAGSDVKPRVLVTRAAGQGSELAERLRGLGADPVLIPAIELAPPISYGALDCALANLESFDWILFTSANAVEVFAKRWQGGPALEPAAIDRVPLASAAPWSMGGLLRPALQGGEPRFHRPKIAAIGPATARVLGEIGFTVDLIPPQAVGESLASALLPYARPEEGRPRRFLLVRAEEAREHLPETLRAAGAEVTVTAAYRTVIPEGSVALLRSLFLPAGAGAPVRAITFTSSSTARNLLALCAAAGVTFPESALRLSIGPITTRTLADLGLPAHAQAAEATVAALAQATMRALGG